MIFEINTIEELHLAAKTILEEFKDVKIFLLNGDLGAGKTTLSREMISILTGITNATSPTFTIVNSYNGNGNIIHHYDLYRLTNEAELQEISLEENLDNGYVLIEWPEKAQNILKRYSKLNIVIEMVENHRLLTASIIN